MATRVLYDRSEISEAVLGLKPSRVAVAYVGKDWAELIAPKSLKEIVLAPIVGTHPDAIRALEARLGWERVHFLDQLHAKVYLGRQAAIVGSANLSTNALGEGQTDLYEAVTVVETKSGLEQARRAFEMYRDIAKTAYPNTDRKEERLKALVEETRRARKAGLMQARPQRTIADYRVGEHRIFVEWYESTGEGGKEGDRTLVDMRFGREAVRRGDWAIIWRCRANGMPREGGAIEWLHIDDVRRRCMEDDDYIDQVAETVRPARGTLPFEIDEQFKALFREIIALEDFEGLRWREGKPRPTPPAALVNALLARIKARYVRAPGKAR